MSLPPLFYEFCFSHRRYFSIAPLVSFCKILNLLIDLSFFRPSTVIITHPAILIMPSYEGFLVHLGILGKITFSALSGAYSQ